MYQTGQEGISDVFFSTMQFKLLQKSNISFDKHHGREGMGHSETRQIASDSLPTVIARSSRWDVLITPR